MIGWLDQLWDTIKAVSVPLLLLGIGFQTLQTLFVALAWRNILRAAYPDAGVKYRPIMRYYAGGVGLSAILPASAGTVAMLGFYRSSIAGSTVAGLVGATVVENGTLLCGHHHRTFERTGWQVRMREGSPEWIPPPWLTRYAA